MGHLIFGLVLTFISLSEVTCGRAPAPSVHVPYQKSCEDFCVTSSVVTIDQIKGIYYMVKMIPHFFLENVSCTYLNVSRELVDGGKYFEAVSVVDGNKRRNFGFLNITDNLIDISYTDLNLPLSGQIISFNADIIAVVYCHDCGFYRKEDAGVYVNIFSNLLHIDYEDLKPIRKALQDCGIPFNALQKVDQHHCRSRKC
ncbi:CLUMA_CG005352, isoform A [Clunio marinus]|uniref:CLUMA_CG005352, isoform A n=1 Tax=Clunio marinus TaxID=568069 RepID=A0A1J1HVY0_9DIPT|nr:CLUMA_CG005352, isoform A [Clunio marinus]